MYNPVAHDLKSPKYKQRIVRNKKKYNRKRMKAEKHYG